MEDSSEGLPLCSEIAVCGSLWMCLIVMYRCSLCRFVCSRIILIIPPPDFDLMLHERVLCKLSGTFSCHYPLFLFVLCLILKHTYRAIKPTNLRHGNISRLLDPDASALSETPRFYTCIVLDLRRCRSTCRSCLRSKYQFHLPRCWHVSLLPGRHPDWRIYYLCRAFHSQALPPWD